MALNTLKCNHLTPLHFKGLTPHSTHTVLNNFRDESFSAIDCTGSDRLLEQVQSALNAGEKSDVRIVGIWRPRISKKVWLLYFKQLLAYENPQHDIAVNYSYRLRQALFCG